MVLWEITLGTAYFLGLKRTYKCFGRIQRRVITLNYPRIRQFVQRRTRTIFHVALKVHLNIQQRDIEVGRNLGNRILRWLDQMKPSAQIRGPSPEKPANDACSNTNVTNQVTNTSHLKASGIGQTSRCQESCRHLITSARSTWSKPFPSIAMMMRPSRPAGIFSQYRHLSIQGLSLLKAQLQHWWWMWVSGGFPEGHNAAYASTIPVAGYLHKQLASQPRSGLYGPERGQQITPSGFSPVPSPQLGHNSQATKNDKAMVAKAHARTTATTGMELADRAVGFLLSLISISTFTYYTFWGYILPFVDSDHFVHQYFLPQEYAILVPVFAGVALLCFLCVFVGFVMLKSKKKKA
uniref:Dolichol phosphate-mannose biosynthesis regulatory protein n=1 Tax=Salix viminalis TaxID=40686 RepID=A0A6N2L6Y1_SALVM